MSCFNYSDAITSYDLKRHINMSEIKLKLISFQQNCKSSSPILNERFSTWILEFLLNISHVPKVQFLFEKILSESLRSSLIWSRSHKYPSLRLKPPHWVQFSYQQPRAFLNQKSIAETPSCFESTSSLLTLPTPLSPPFPGLSMHGEGSFSLWLISPTEQVLSIFQLFKKHPTIEAKWNLTSGRDLFCHVYIVASALASSFRAYTRLRSGPTFSHPLPHTSRLLTCARKQPRGSLFAGRLLLRRTRRTLEIFAPSFVNRMLRQLGFLLTKGKHIARTIFKLSTSSGFFRLRVLGRSDITGVY